MISVPAARWVPGRLPGLPAVEAYFCPGTVMAGLRPIYKTLGEPPGKQVDRHRLSRPSLKITRQRSSSEADAFVIEVWNPFTGSYQLADTVKHAMRRVEELANLIYQMRLRRHPKQHVLADAPNVDRTDKLQWAEFRINASTYRSYDTRRFDRPSWMRETSLAHAAKLTCAKVGCAVPL
jgi:hypothetical protein